jgi:hypothetical protein
MVLRALAHVMALHCAVSTHDRLLVHGMRHEAHAGHADCRDVS